MKKARRFWRLVYGENDGQAGTEGQAGAGQDQSAQASQTPSKPRTFTQDEVNSFLAKEKKTFQTQQQKLINDLSQLKETASLTANEKQELEARIEELQKSSMTKEELLKREQDKLKTKYDQDLKNLEQDREIWRKRYTVETINRSILDEAIKGDAYSPEQMVTILGSQAKLVEVFDESGKPTGSFITKIPFSDVDKEKRPVTLELTVAETVKRMKELPDRFGNLFKSGAVSGMGSSNSGYNPKSDAPISDAENYRKNRDRILKEKR